MSDMSFDEQRMIFGGFVPVVLAWGRFLLWELALQASSAGLKSNL